jgi:hypothetical protein
VCFTYAIWFGVLGLVAAGQTYETSFHIRMACKFLLSKQLPDGGWGESYLSCQDKVKILQFLVSSSDGVRRVSRKEIYRGRREKTSVCSHDIDNHLCVLGKNYWFSLVQLGG